MTEEQKERRRQSLAVARAAKAAKSAAASAQGGGDGDSSRRRSQRKALRKMKRTLREVSAPGAVSDSSDDSDADISEKNLRITERAVALLAEEIKKRGSSQSERRRPAARKRARAASYEDEYLSDIDAEDYDDDDRTPSRREYARGGAPPVSRNYGGALRRPAPGYGGGYATTWNGPSTAPPTRESPPGAQPAPTQPYAPPRQPTYTAI